MKFLRIRRARLALSTVLLLLALGVVSTAAAQPAARPVDANVLLLVDSAGTTVFDDTACKLADYLGSACAALVIENQPLRDLDLTAPEHEAIRVVVIDAARLSLLDAEALETLAAAVSEAGVNLLVANVTPTTASEQLAALTGGVVSGATAIRDTARNWTVTEKFPELSLELSGQSIHTDSARMQGDYALTLATRSTRIKRIITSTDDQGQTYVVFAAVTQGSGYIFVASGEMVEALPLRSLYYTTEHFSQIMPLMFALRFSLGDMAWHSVQDYANLTIDDPSLTEPFRNLSFSGLLQEMETHNFSTTIAYIPANQTLTQPAVVSLFHQHAERYSLVQHGNNHDGYEFYYYQIPADVPALGEDYSARPLDEQQNNIVQGLSRMVDLQVSTGLPFGRVMIFPFGISPEPTLRTLKRFNYLATVNAEDAPLGSTRPDRWNYGMYQANMDYEAFPVIERNLYVDDYGSGGIRSYVQTAFLNLYVDRPALFWSHAVSGELFTSGIDQFSPIADAVNGLNGDVQWQSLEQIIERLCLQKTNNDGSVDVMIYGNHFLLTNTAEQAQTYHITKTETLNVPIKKVTVDGSDQPYRVEDGLFTLDVKVEPQQTIELWIVYGANNE